MHMLVLVVIGLVVLGAFAGIGYALKGTAGAGQAAAIFIWVWLVASIANGAFGYVRAGIPLLNEIGAFIPIFGVPAVVAFFAWRYFASG